MWRSMLASSVLVNPGLSLQHDKHRITSLVEFKSADKVPTINQDTYQTARAATQAVVNRSLSIGKDACHNHGVLNFDEMTLVVSKFLYDGEC
jgi:hypothetical protein